MSIEFVWNRTLGEQVRSHTERAMQGQSSDMRSTAEQFIREAQRQETEANRLEATLPIMRTVTFTRTNAAGETVETWTEIQEDTVATLQRRAQIVQMRQQAQEVRRAAAELRRAADELDRATTAINRRFHELHQMMQNIDAACATRMQLIKDEIAGYIRMMEGVRDSFGGSVGSALGDGPLTIGMLANAALSAINPRLAAQLAGLQPSCASGLDPINLATGNFYYTKEDLTIPGRYPLAFTRFYNAIGGFNSILGPNWTHNYNIRLYNENEGEHIRITFEDGHTEQFKRLEENFYVSPLEGKNSLIVPEDEEGGFILTRPNMDVYRFDDTGALCYIIDTNGNEISFEYGESEGQSESQSEGEGQSQGTIKSDNQNIGQSGNQNIQQDISPAQVNKTILLTKVSTQSGSLHFTYNEAGRLTKVTDHTGREVIFGYGVTSSASSNINPNAITLQHLTQVTHPTSATYHYSYNSHGLLSQITNPMGVTFVQNLYDKDGRTIHQEMADGGKASIEYNDTHRINTFTEQNGNKIEYYRDERYRTTRIAYADSDERFVYDDYNNRTGYTDRNKNSWQYEYDLHGNITKTIDPLGNITEVEYSDLNKPTKITTPSGGKTILTYDDYGNLTNTTDPIGRAMNIENDETGKAISVTIPDHSRSTIEYDPRGNISAITDAQGVTIRYEHNNLNRITKTTNGEGAATYFEHNAKGDITKVTDAQGNTRTYEYNLSGKVTRITDADGSTVKYRYNKSGKVEEVTDQAGGVTKLTYDIMQNITSITDPMGN